MRASRRSALIAGAAVICVQLAGCGYHMAGGGAALPEDVRSISVGKIENRSREFGLEKSLAFAFEREFMRRGLVRVESDPGGGDAVISGTIRRFYTFPVSFNVNDAALQYQASLLLDLTLRRQRDGQVLWEVHGLREIDEYSVAANVVITSSSEFQRGQLNSDDLTKLSDIQLAETQKKLAIERLLVAAVRDAHDQMLEGF